MSTRFRKKMELPFELVEEILSRVHVKDLIRFRRVCKSWRSLLQDEKFIRKHRTHAQRRIIFSRGLRSSLCHFVYESGKPETALEEVDLNIGDKSLLPESSVIGHCHGLLCLILPDDSFGIWNPSLRELRRIPRYINKPGEMGFGYDYSTQDYKILVVQDIEGGCSKANVFSLKSGVSRMIDFPCLDNFEMCHLKSPGTLLGENIYWRVYDLDFNMADTILSFDLESETFKYCPGPSTYGQPLAVALEVLKGGLCTVGFERSNLGDELVMWSAQYEKEKNGVIKSWSKILRLPWDLVESSISPRVHDAWLVSAITYEGLLLFVIGTESGPKLLAYNFEEKSLRLVETSLSLDRGGSLNTYFETLVPIPILPSNPLGNLIPYLLGEPTRDE